jgi:hypothetical protein
MFEIITGALALTLVLASFPRSHKTERQSREARTSFRTLDELTWNLVQMTNGPDLYFVILLSPSTKIMG